MPCATACVPRGFGTGENAQSRLCIFREVRRQSPTLRVPHRPPLDSRDRRVSPRRPSPPRGGREAVASGGLHSARRLASGEEQGLRGVRHAYAGQRTAAGVRGSRSRWSTPSFAPPLPEMVRHEPLPEHLCEQRHSPALLQRCSAHFWACSCPSCQGKAVFPPIPRL